MNRPAQPQRRFWLSGRGASNSNAWPPRLIARHARRWWKASLTPRPMGVGNGRKPHSYNLQTVVDAETGLIVHHEITTEPTDNRLLYPMAKATKTILGVESLMVVADAGYSNGAAAAACEADGITPCAPTNRAVNNQGDGTMFDRSAFVYQQETDTYVCPANRSLARRQMMRRDALIL